MKYIAKYIANPVEVTAYQIKEVSPLRADGVIVVVAGDADGQSENATFEATPEMTSRMVPQPGDYWVIQSDGYVYLNPKAVFERKYRPA